MTTNKVYGLITDRLIASLEKGHAVWRKPWRGGHAGMPHNAVSKHQYRGINPFILTATAAAAGYTDPRWVTFKQAVKLGGSVKGEKSTPVVFWKWLDGEDADGNPRRIPFLRYYSVFNVEQCAGISLAPFVLDTANNPIAPIAAAEAIVARMPNRPVINHDGGDKAFYRPSTDAISLPVRESFDSAEDYYATTFHELVHSTGHMSRVGRFSAEETIAAFGSESYSKEELVAEFGAAFLCGYAGIEHMTEPQHAAYLQSWIRVLKSDVKLAVQAAARAQRATDYIRGVKYSDAA